jgi:hypothetical protein
MPYLKRYLDESKGVLASGQNRSALVAVLVVLTVPDKFSHVWGLGEGHEDSTMEKWLTPVFYRSRVGEMGHPRPNHGGMRPA